MSRRLLLIVSLLTVAAMILTACAPQPTPEAPTAAPAAPTAEPAAWEPKYNTTAPDPAYGGSMQSIEALDQYTVKFTLNVPDPAFLSKIAFGPFEIHSAQEPGRGHPLERGSGGPVGGTAGRHGRLHGQRQPRRL
jgi:ABC-type oligopeptide transport system substrate-binding subunit